MIFEGTLILTAAGLGAWMPSARVRDYGISLFTGYCLIPLLLFLLMGAAGLSLPAACRVVGFLAVAGGIFSLRSFLRKKTADFLLHPGLLLTAVSLLLAGALFHEPYLARIWDEFGYWLLMPKQILVTGNLPSAAMPYAGWYLGYTPGWPLTIAFLPPLTGISWQQAPVLYLPLFLGIAFLALIYDIARNAAGEKERSISPAGWGAVLLVFLLGSPSVMLPQYMLIEPPQILSLSAVLALLLLHAYKKESRLRDLIPVGLVLAAAYLFKKPAAAVFPGIAIFLLWPSQNRRLRKRFLETVVVFLPVFLIAAIWLGVKQAPSEVGDKFPSFSEILSVFHTGERAFLAGLFRQGIKDYIADLDVWGWIRLACAAAGISAALTDRKRRAWGILPIFFFVVYSLGIYFLYAVVFSVYLAESLASFERYTHVLFLTLAMTGGLALYLRCCGNGLVGQILNIRGVAIFLLGASVLIYARSLDLRGEGKFDEDVLETREQSLEVRRRVEKDGRRGERILMVLQQGRAIPVFISRYESYDPQAGLVFKLVRAPYWTARSTPGALRGPRRQKTTALALEKRMRNFALIWVYQSDGFTRRVLRRLAGDCAVSRKDPFLVVRNRKTGKYTCEAF